MTCNSKQKKKAKGNGAQRNTKILLANGGDSSILFSPNHNIGNILIQVKVSNLPFKILKIYIVPFVFVLSQVLCSDLFTQ